MRERGSRNSVEERAWTESWEDMGRRRGANLMGGNGKNWKGVEDPSGLCRLGQR